MTRPGLLRYARRAALLIAWLAWVQSAVSWALSEHAAATSPDVRDASATRSILLSGAAARPRHLPRRRLRGARSPVATRPASAGRRLGPRAAAPAESRPGDPHGWRAAVGARLRHRPAARVRGVVAALGRRRGCRDPRRRPGTRAGGRPRRPHCRPRGPPAARHGAAVPDGPRPARARGTRSRRGERRRVATPLGAAPGRAARAGDGAVGRPRARQGPRSLPPGPSGRRRCARPGPRGARRPGWPRGAGRPTGAGGRATRGRPRRRVWRGGIPDGGGAHVRRAGRGAGRRARPARPAGGGRAAPIRRSGAGVRGRRRAHRAGRRHVGGAHQRGPALGSSGVHRRGAPASGAVLGAHRRRRRRFRAAAGRRTSSGPARLRRASHGGDGRHRRGAQPPRRWLPGAAQLGGSRPGDRRRHRPSPGTPRRCATC